MKNYNFLINDLSGGGAERVLSILSSDLASKGIVRIFLLNDIIVHKIDERIEVIRLSITRMPFLNLLLAPFLLVYYSYYFKISILQSHLFKSNYINALSKIIGARYNIQMVHCVSFSSKFSNKTWRRRLHLLFMRLFYIRSGLHIFKSEDMKVDYQKILKIPDYKCKVIYNPVNVESIIQNNSILNQKLFSSEFSIVVVGRFHETKQQLKILYLLKSLPSSITLHFVGDGEELQRCKKYVLQENLSSRVFFYGRVNNPVDYMRSADIVLSFSKAEGFPNTLVEALACGACCVHSDCLSGPREILSRPLGVSYLGFYKAPFGFLFDCTAQGLIESILELYQNRDLIENYRKLGPVRARAYDKLISIDEYKRCFYD